jgi:hypothetical protein
LGVSVVKLRQAADGYSGEKCSQRDGESDCLGHSSGPEQVAIALAIFATCSLSRGKITVPKMYPMVGTGAFLGLLACIRINKLCIVNSVQ